MPDTKFKKPHIQCKGEMARDDEVNNVASSSAAMSPTHKYIIL